MVPEGLRAPPALIAAYQENGLELPPGIENARIVVIPNVTNYVNEDGTLVFPSGRAVLLAEDGSIWAIPSYLFSRHMDGTWYSVASGEAVDFTKISLMELPKTFEDGSQLLVRKGMFFWGTKNEDGSYNITHTINTKGEIEEIGRFKLIWENLAHVVDNIGNHIIDKKVVVETGDGVIAAAAFSPVRSTPPMKQDDIRWERKDGYDVLTWDGEGPVPIAYATLTETDNWEYEGESNPTFVALIEGTTDNGTFFLWVFSMRENAQNFREYKKLIPAFNIDTDKVFKQFQIEKRNELIRRYDIGAIILNEMKGYPPDELGNVIFYFLPYPLSSS